MNLYRNRQTGSLDDEAALRASFCGTLPAILDAATLEAIGYDPIFDAPEPTLSFGQSVFKDGVEQGQDGNWYVKWLVIDPPADIMARQLASAQEMMWLRIKAERDKRKAGGVKLSISDKEYWFWTDDPSRGQYSMLDSMIRRNNLPDSYVLDQWKTMTGEFIAFTVTLLHNVMDSGIANESAIFRAAETHRLAMIALDNPYLYDYSVNWPQSYEEWVIAQANSNNSSS